MWRQEMRQQQQGGDTSRSFRIIVRSSNTGPTSSVAFLRGLDQVLQACPPSLGRGDGVTCRGFNLPGAARLGAITPSPTGPAAGFSCSDWTLSPVGCGTLIKPSIRPV